MPRPLRRVGYVMTVAALLFICLLTLLPAPHEVVRAARTPVYCILCGELGGVDFLLNILLFLPLGAGLTLAGFSWRRAIALAALLSCGIELLQMKVIIGRDASLGDILANTLGGGLGALLVVSWSHVRRPSPQTARRLAISSAGLLVAIWALTAWALGPTAPDSNPWFGAWAPELGGFDQFQGRVFAVTVGGEPLLPGRALDQRRLKQAVAADPTMTASMVLGERSKKIAPIGLVLDGGQGHIMLLGAERQDMVFGLRMRASALKLWNPRINLKDGMDGQPGDTVEATGGLRNGTIELSSRIASTVRTRTLPLSASWGWSLVTPWSSVIGEEVLGLTAFWIIGLVALLAYWSVLAGGAALAIVPATAAVLFAAVPYAAGFPPAHWSEWVAALVGTGFGAIAGIAALRKSRSQVDRDEA